MKFKKFALAAAAAATLGGFGSAQAALTFDINPGNLMPGYAGLGTITADSIRATYTELATFTGATTVDFSGAYTVTAFRLTGVVTPLTTGLGTSPSASTYHMYGLFQGTGVFDPMTGTITTNPLSMFSLWLDPDWDTVISAGASGSVAFNVVQNTPDIKLLDGDILDGVATGVTARGGFVDQLSAIALTAAGDSFFVSPDPFYSLSVQTGNIHNALSTTVGFNNELEGELTITFAVPEPGSLALAGLALVGAAGALRKKRGA